MNPLAPYMFWIKWGLVAIVVALLVRWLVGMGYDHCELEHYKAQEKLISQAADSAAKTDKKLAALLAKPKVAPKIDEVVRANPSHCVVPKPVGDRLREAIHQANAAN